MKINKIMRLLAILLCFIATQATLRADNGDWRIYAAYHNATQVAVLHGIVYVLSDGSLYSYDPDDTSVETYDKAKTLSDVGIYAIVPCADTGELVLLYRNGNIDLLDIHGDTYNLPDLKMKELGDKTLNEVTVNGSLLYISTNSGLVCVDLARRAFGNFFSLGQKVTSATQLAGSLYATTPAGVYQGHLSDNLLDPSKWTLLNKADVPDLSTANHVRPTNSVKLGSTVWKACGQDGLQGYDEEGNITTSSVIPNSPIRNFTENMSIQPDGRLLIAGGTFSYFGENRQGTLMQYDNHTWTFFDEEGPSAQPNIIQYMNTTDLVQDPKDPTHHFASAARTGLYEFRDYKMVAQYNNENTPLASILPDNPNAHRFVRVTGLAFDSQDNLWMCNTEVDTIVRIRRNDGSWTGYYVPELAGYPTFDHTVFDRRGWAWINSRRSTAQNHHAGFLVINTNGNPGNPNKFTHQFTYSLTNQDGTNYLPTLFYCCCEDLDGAMWLGCDQGLFVLYDPTVVFTPDFNVTQVKVPRNDGTNLADYLLASVPVKCMAIDGGNRKWIGTDGSGVFLVSADGLETIAQFTMENSPLISNSINDIAINGQTGEVFISTSEGLVSYMGDATDPAASLDKDNVVVYPNPVRPEYQGNITITGLVFDSDVRIVNAAGYLVNHGTSVGGTYTWNGRLSSGKRCANGIYYVLATDSAGNNGVVAKFLMVQE